MSDLKILITGSEGFAGQYLTNHLLKLGYEVYGTHFQSPPLEKRIPYFFLDIRDDLAVKKILKELSPDGIFHLASISSVALSFQNEKMTYEVNTIGTLNLLIALRELKKPCRLIFISTAEVYGQQKECKPFSEKCPVNPISPYALSKYFAEKLVLHYVKIHQLDGVILRPFSHTGIGQKEDFFFPTCCKRIIEIEKQGKGVLEVGNIEVWRDYLSVEDVVLAYELAFRRGQRGEIYNIACGRPIKLRNAVRFLISLAKAEIKLKINPERERKWDIPYLSGNPQKFKKATGYKPTVGIKSVLKKMLEYYRCSPNSL